MLQSLTKGMEPGLIRTAVYAGPTLIIALAISFLIRRSQFALNIAPFKWGKPSNLLWGMLIGLMISTASGIGFGLSQGYPLQMENLFNNFFSNALRQASPALVEEIVFRAGIVHSTLQLFGNIAGLASGSVPFGILHLAGLLFGQSVTAAQIFGISLAGLMLSLMYLRFGILGAFGTHLVWNALVRGWLDVYGVTDRAVVSDLEGSWVTCLILAAVSIFLFSSGKRHTQMDSNPIPIWAAPLHQEQLDI